MVTLGFNRSLHFSCGNNVAAITLTLPVLSATLSLLTVGNEKVPLSE
jgi:hypothetical protein